MRVPLSALDTFGEGGKVGDSTYACGHAGCARTFTTPQGLALHRTRSHTTADAWSADDDATLRDLAGDGVRMVADAVGRTLGAVVARAGELGVELGTPRAVAAASVEVVALSAVSEDARRDALASEMALTVRMALALTATLQRVAALTVTPARG